MHTTILFLALIPKKKILWWSRFHGGFICAYSDYSNIKQSAPFSLPLCTVIATLSQLLHINVLQAVPFCGYAWSMHASTDRTEILDAGAQLWVVLKDFSNGGSWMSCRSLEKKCVQWWREPWVPKMRQCHSSAAGDAGGKSAVCRKWMCCLHVQSLLPKSRLT